MLNDMATKVMTTIEAGSLGGKAKAQKYTAQERSDQAKKSWAKRKKKMTKKQLSEKMRQVALSRYQK